MDRLSVSQPRRIGDRGHCAPQPTGSPAWPAFPVARRSPRSIIYSGTLDLALTGLAVVPEPMVLVNSAPVVRWHRQDFRLYRR